MTGDPWKLKEQAERVAKNKGELADLVNNAAEKATSNRDAVGSLFDALDTLLRLLGAWAGGLYTCVPWHTIVLAVIAVLYFILPVDAIPDFLPAIGFSDDLGVIALVITSIWEDLKRFRKWEKGCK